MERVNINSYFTTYIKQNPFTFLIYFLLLFVYPLHRIVLPKYYGIVIASLKSKFDSKSSADFFKNVSYLLGIYIVIQTMYSLIYKVQGYIIPKFSEYSLLEIFSSLLSNKDLDYENLEVGEILAKIIKVPNVIYKYLDLVRALFFSQLMVILSCIYHYYSISFKTGSVFVGLVCGIFALQYIAYKLTMDIELDREHKKDDIYQHFQDVLNNLLSIILCKQEKFERNLMHNTFQPYIKIFEKSLNIDFIIRVIFSIFNLISFILLNYLIYSEFEQSTITREEFIASFIVTYSILGLFNEGYYAIRSIIDMYSQIVEMEQFFNSKYVEKDEPDNGNADAVKSSDQESSITHGNIEFKGVTYVYGDNKNFKDENLKYALRDVNLNIKKNEKVAIIGQIGSGKSTLVKMMLKLIEPSSGKVSINGKDLTSISRDDLYDYIFFVPQRPKLLNRTLFDNIIYGLPYKKADKSQIEEKIIKMMKELHIHENIQNIFKEKMDLPVGADGVKLSGGQRQIVWMLRALMRNPKVMIFDEPTAALDKENKQIILDAIQKMGKDKTIIVISHDPIYSNFRKIELKQGVIVYQTKNNEILSIIQDKMNHDYGLL